MRNCKIKTLHNTENTKNSLNLSQALYTHSHEYLKKKPLNTWKLKRYTLIKNTFMTNKAEGENRPSTASISEFCKNLWIFLLFSKINSRTIISDFLTLKFY